MEEFKPFPLNDAVMVGNNGTIKRPNGKIAKQSVHNLGYLCCGMSVSGKFRMMKAHRVIALTWVDNPDNKPTVNHKNGIKTDNRAINLEWLTLSENHQHAWNTGLQPKTRAKGRKHTEATKQRMREAKKGRFRLGKSGTWTDEPQRKIKNFIFVK